MRRRSALSGGGGGCPLLSRRPFCCCGSWEPAGQNHPGGATLLGVRFFLLQRESVQSRGGAEPTRFRSGVIGGTHGRRAAREPWDGLCCGSASPAPTSGSARHSPRRLPPLGGPGAGGRRRRMLRAWSREEGAGLAL